MELETLEVIIEANIEKFSEQLQRIMPLVEQTMGRLESFTGQSINKTEKKMDVGDGVNNMNKQFEQLTKMYEKNLEMLEKLTTASSNNIKKGLTKGFQSSRKTVGKEVDALVKDINAKMGRAKAEQEKLAFLQAQRQDASSKGDTKNVVKYDSQIARAQEMMNKYQSQAKQMADAIKNEFKTLPQSLDAISDEMIKNEGVIESQKAKVRELTALYEQQAKKIPKLSESQMADLRSRYSSTFDPGYQKEVKQAGFKFEDTKSSKKTGAEISRNNKEIQKLISRNDALQRSYAEAEDRTKALRSAVKGLNTELGKSQVQTGNAAVGAKKIGQGADKSKGLFSKFGGVFNRTSNKIAHGSKRMTSGLGGFTHRLGQMVKQAFIFSVIYKGLMLVSRGLFSALKTNDEFNNSLNQIKVNLLTAFYPIYSFVLPAINAMMRGLAIATGQIAHFTASLFGTTYTAAKAGAQGLYQNVQAMNDSGNAADKNREKVKKLQRSLMGFDEINRIGLDDKDEDFNLDNNKNGVNFNTPNPPMPDWVPKANSILKDFFKPFQDSWGKHGKTVTDAWKYALGEVELAAQSVGKSFMEVWTNGTGERFLSNILVLVANLLGLVGDVAKAFHEAWDENERGTKLIQAIFDLCNELLELINEIVKSFREAWSENNLGKSILSHILEIMTDLIEAAGFLAEGLKNAWKEGSVGTSIFSTILGAFDGILEVIERASKSTKEWAKELDFTPLLKSIDKLLKPISKISKNVFEALEWGYTNAFLPLAKLIIENILPNFFKLLGNALEIIANVIERLKPLFDWFFNKLMKPILDFTMSLVGDWLDFLAKFGQALEDLITIDVHSFGDVVDGFVQFGKDIWNGLKEGLKSVKDNAETYLKEAIFDPIVKAFKKLFGIHSPSTVFAEFGSFLIEGLFVGIEKLMSKPVELVKKLWDEMSGAVKTKGSVIWESSKKTWDDVSTKVKVKAGEAWTNTKDNWEKIKRSTGDNFESVRKSTAEKWDNVKSKISSSSTEAKNNAASAWSNMRDRVSGYNESIKSNTRNAFNNVVQGARELGGRIGSGMNSGRKSVENGAKTIANALKGFPIRAVNAVKNGVGWVLSKLGAKNTMGKDYVVNYAQGTGYHPGGQALVNDGYGANFREAYRLPNGKTGLFPNQRNLMVNLPAGSSVLSGPRTASLMSGKVPKYAGGVGKWFKERWEGVKEFTGDVWDYMTHPEKLVEVGISKFANFKGAIEPSLSMAQGSISSSMKAATQFVKEKMEELFDSGDADTSPTGTMGVMQYLSNIAHDVMKKFPGMVPTSGYRHGDPYSHGKRQAIDIAFPSNMNGSSAYFEPANYAFNKYRDKVAYVITQGKVKDRTGMSGTGSSGQWRHWPDNDHYDHLHINGSIAQGQGGSRGGGSTGGSWASQIKKAARAMGQTVNSSEINGILAQIQRESGGNQNIVQSSAVWDVNMANGNPAQGLLQYIPSTFNAYKMRGYENIRNGYHQLLAFFNNSNWRYDLPYGNRGWGPTGRRIRPYAQGSPYIPEDQLALIHKGEMIVPAKFNPFNSMGNFETLKMPDLFTENVSPTTYTPKLNNDVGGGMSGATESIINALLMALDMRNSEGEKGGDINITLELESEKVAKAVINEVNKETVRQGKSPLLI